MEAYRAKVVVTGAALDREPDSVGAEKIKVLFLMIQMGMGGTQRLIYNLVRNIDRRIFAPSIGWFIEEHALNELKEFEQLQVPLYRIPKLKRFDMSTMNRIAQIVKDQQIDIINAHHFMSFFYTYYAARIASHVRIVYTEHSKCDVLSVAGKWRAAGICLLASCDAVVGVSERVSRMLASHFRLNPEIVHTIENGVDGDLFGKSNEAPSHLREELGFAPDDIVIGNIANFDKNKNHLFLLRAFREMVRERSDLRLVFVGKGLTGNPESTETEITTYIRDNGLGDKVRLTGYRPDVHHLLSMMDIFSLVSYNEGLPFSLIEAMASGLPVLGTDVEGIRGLIEPEVNGLVVVPDDVRGLALALTRLIEDRKLRQRMGAASRRIASEKYSLKRCTEETQQLFLSMLSERPIHLESAGVAAS